MPERWKQVGDSNYYVSDYGKVRGLRGAVRLRTIKGRYVVRIFKRTTTLSVHRLVAIAFIPNPENHPLVKFIDGDMSNCNWTNLEWVPRPSHPCVCKICGAQKPFKHFRKIWNKSGVEYRRHVCNSCLGKADYARRKEKMFEKLFTKPKNEIPDQLQSPSRAH